MEDTQIKYFIEADGELRRKIAAIAKKSGMPCSLPSISRALNYSDMSVNAYKIRRIALEHGAVKMEVKVSDIQKA
jgi:hypothetical protein